MQLKEFDILLDIKNRNNTDAFEVVQGDSYSNVINVALVDGLDPFDLTDTHIEIVFKKSDGTTVMQNDIILVDAVQGKIQCILKTNTIASHGKTVSEIRVMEGEVLLTSTTFEFYVRKALLNDETIESTNEFPVLTQLINTTERLIEQVGQIEKQVPEQVVTELSAVSIMAGQLQAGLTDLQTELVDLEAGVNTHLADYAILSKETTLWSGYANSGSLTLVESADNFIGLAIETNSNPESSSFRGGLFVPYALNPVSYFPVVYGQTITWIRFGISADSLNISSMGTTELNIVRVAGVGRRPNTGGV